MKQTRHFLLTAIMLLCSFAVNAAMLDGHEYVDLGLPSKKLWATTNYGASTPEGYGSYLNWNNVGIISSAWSDKWTAPSYYDAKELVTKCTWTESTQNGVKGYTVTGPNGNSIFLPSAGWSMDGYKDQVGKLACYWTTTSGDMDGFAYTIYANNGTADYHQTYNSALMQVPVRPISTITATDTDSDSDMDSDTEEEATSIKSLSELSNAKLYHISQPNHTHGATSWAVQTGGERMKSNKDLNIPLDSSDPRQQFAFVTYDNGNTYYLYHPAEMKFVNKDGTLGNWAVDAIRFKDGAYEETFMAYFDDSHYINVGGSSQMLINGWSTPDGGNSCSILSVGEFDQAEVPVRMEIDGLLYRLIPKTKEAIVVQGDYAGDITIPATVSYGNDVYPVVALGFKAFYGCANLTSVSLPASVDSIAECAFEGCSNLTAINIPEGVTNINSYTFKGCSRLTEISIPASVLNLNFEAFMNCTALTTVIFAEGSRLEKIHSSAFCYCSSLTNINIPEGVMSIGTWTFEGCTSLVSVSIPEGVTSIGAKAFKGCSSLQEVRCYAESIPETPKGNTFDETPIENAMLYVPAALVDTYRTTAPWSGFGSINSLDDEPEEVKVCAAPTISYADGIVSFLCETEGVTFKSTTVVEDAGGREVADFELTATYVISVYATKEGYTDSEVTTATLCWVPCDKNHDSEETDIITIPAKPVLIQTDGGTIIVNGLAEGTVVKVNDLNGVELGTATATGGTATITITTSLTTGSVAIVKIGGYSVKVAIK